MELALKKTSHLACVYFRWYEAKVTGWKCTSSLKSLVVSVLAKDNVPNCKIMFIDEVIIHLSNYSHVIHPYHQFLPQ